MVSMLEIARSEGVAAPTHALDLAAVLQLPTPSGARADLRALLRAGSVPRFRPERWNDGISGPLQRSNNCYNYACDVQSSTFAIPGVGGGLGLGGANCPDMTTGAVTDGLISTGDVEDPAGIEFGHRVALVVIPTGADFHWYRRDRDGTWSHKRGKSAAKNLDDSDRPITDPRAADRGRYTTFCGFFSVPRGDVTLGGPAQLPPGQFPFLRPPGDRTVVRLLVFSGRPDPEWTLDPDEEMALLGKLATSRTRARITAAPPRDRLGYLGFEIDRPGATAGTREITTAHRGVVSDVRATGQGGLEHRPDVDDIEQELLDQARRRGFDPLL
jgi:hypothetical protein